ncbi:MAG: PTS sugar transporter subunit IIA [Planctomycetes bacterium]|nr:PTS sugar transporter subunit IIA [Planctomycetota bacterium]
MTEDKADAFLRMIRRSQYGRLKVYLGYCAGVGKTYQMLAEGLRLRSEGIDAVIGLLEAHGRTEILKLAKGLETVHKRRCEYHGVAVEEMDVDAILARKPKVVLIDELAHTNIPDSKNPKRYQDIQDILAAGIHVVTTMNIQHLETLFNIVENVVGVKVLERIPDSVLADADQIVDVDLTTEDLRKRLKEGKIYPSDQVETALANFFTPSNLEKLRELALRELVSQIDLRRREISEDENPAAADQIMVCLSSRGPNSEKLLRYASRLAGKLNRNWYAVYVQTPQEEIASEDSRNQALTLISKTLSLAKQLGAVVFTYKGEDIPNTILRFAKEYRVGHIIIGKSPARPFWKRFGPNKNIPETLVKNAKGVSVVIFDAPEKEPVPEKKTNKVVQEMAPLIAGTEQLSARLFRPGMGKYLSQDRIVIWNELVKKETVLRALAERAVKNKIVNDTEALMDAVMKREELGSTFFNEGMALPHVRINGLQQAAVAIGLTKQGVMDSSAEKAIEIVFLIISPAQTPNVQIEILSLASRIAQNRHLMQNLMAAQAPDIAMKAIQDWEAADKPDLEANL